MNKQSDKKFDWFKLVSFLVKAFIVYICIMMIWGVLDDRTIGGLERLFWLVMVVAVSLIFTSDFNGGLIKWFKNLFNKFD